METVISTPYFWQVATIIAFFIVSSLYSRIKHFTKINKIMAEQSKIMEEKETFRKRRIIQEHPIG